MSVPSPTARLRWPLTHEPRWPAILAVATALLLYIALPRKLTLGPLWLVPALELALLLPLSVAASRVHLLHRPWVRPMAIVLIAIINASNVGSLALLVRELLTPGNKMIGQTLFFASASIWLTNIIVYALWFWELDRGGPNARLFGSDRGPDFLFPQMTGASAGAWPNWAPKFLDYLYVALTNATAFSPTDTMPLTPWAKTLMGVQSLVSLLTIALVAARAVNILA